MFCIPASVETQADYLLTFCVWGHASLPSSTQVLCLRVLEFLNCPNFRKEIHRINRKCTSNVQFPFQQQELDDATAGCDAKFRTEASHQSWPSLLFLDIKLGHPVTFFAGVSCGTLDGAVGDGSQK